MKRFLSILLIISQISFGQSVTARFYDTTAANASVSKIKNIVGYQIFTTSENKFWLRNSTATAWINIGSEGSSALTDTLVNTLTAGVKNVNINKDLTARGNVGIGTNADNSFKFKSWSGNGLVGTIQPFKALGQDSLKNFFGFLGNSNLVDGSYNNFYITTHDNPAGDNFGSTSLSLDPESGMQIIRYNGDSSHVSFIVFGDAGLMSSKDIFSAASLKGKNIPYNTLTIGAVDWSPNFGDIVFYSGSALSSNQTLDFDLNMPTPQEGYAFDVWVTTAFLNGYIIQFNIGAHSNTCYLINGDPVTKLTGDKVNHFKYINGEWHVSLTD